jgi:SAM-dependent methyltransferase
MDAEEIMELDPNLARAAQAFADAPVLPYLPAPTDLTTAVPWNPSAEVQRKFVGATFEEAFREAAAFVQQGEAWIDGNPVAPPDTLVLDFGSGWGRITRLLLTQFNPAQIYCLDVDPAMTALVDVTLPGVNIVTGSSLPPSPFRDGLFSRVYAFSVFSHLAEQAHQLWAQEFGRVVAPGGFACITVLDEVFLDQIAACQAAVAAGGADDFATSLAGLVDDIDRARLAFSSGGFVYGDPGPDGPRTGDFYGWAAASRPWVERHWRDAGFDVQEWIPSGVLFQQAMVLLRRR